MEFQNSAAIRLLLLMTVLVLVTIFFVAAIYFARHEAAQPPNEITLSVDIEDVITEMDEEDWLVSVEHEGKWIDGSVNRLDRIELVARILSITMQDRTFYKE